MRTRLLLPLALCATSFVTVPARAQEKFTYLSNWYAQAEHGGFYQALATGLYKQAGLDVTLKMGGPQVNGMQLLMAGQAWTGWHAIEKDLWPPASDYTPFTADERTALADLLVVDTTDLSARVQELTYDATQLGNGAKELLDEVATGKVTGEEEIWSHTDLWDFQANVDGARIAFENLQPALETKDPDLATTLTERFTALQQLLDRHRDGEGFQLYTELSTAEIKALADAVNALSEPLAELTAAVVL